MTQYKSNLFANFAGAGVAAMLQLVFIPFYIKFLGIEAYGLIGFYIMLQAVLQVLDFGLGPTLNREMARYSVQTEKAGEARDFTRTLEIGYWVTGITAGAIIVISAPLIATRWVNVGSLPLPVVQKSLLLMGGLAAFQLPLSMYQGGLMGLQRQVLLNGVRITMAILGSGGAVIILWLVSPTITAFLEWQLVVTAGQTAVLGWSLWRSLPPSAHTPRFAPTMLRNVWRFAAGMSGITVSSLILTQLDKIILSKLLPLKMFGYYTLATAVGNGLYVLITPVFSATFPRLSALVAARDEDGVRELYHRGSQLMAALVLPLASILVFFPEEVLSVWTGNMDTARAAAPIVRFLVIGTAINGIMSLPYALQLAHGWTKLGLLITVALIVVMTPSIYIASLHYGAVGAAFVWALLNVLYMGFGVPLTHRKLLVGDTRRWFLGDVAFPMATSLLIAGVARGFLTLDPSRRIDSALELSGLLLIVAWVTALVSPVLRNWIGEQWKELRGLYV